MNFHETAKKPMVSTMKTMSMTSPLIRWKVWEWGASKWCKEAEWGYKENVKILAAFEEKYGGSAPIMSAVKALLVL